jgi:hypothetical protein
LYHLTETYRRKNNTQSVGGDALEPVGPYFKVVDIAKVIKTNWNYLFPHKPPSQTWRKILSSSISSNSTTLFQNGRAVKNEDGWWNLIAHSPPLPKDATLLDFKKKGVKDLTEMELNFIRNNECTIISYESFLNLNSTKNSDQDKNEISKKTTSESTNSTGNIEAKPTSHPDSNYPVSIGDDNSAFIPTYPAQFSMPMGRLHPMMAPNLMPPTSSMTYPMSFYASFQSHMPFGISSSYSPTSFAGVPGGTSPYLSYPYGTYPMPHNPAYAFAQTRPYIPFGSAASPLPTAENPSVKLEESSSLEVKNEVALKAEQGDSVALTKVKNEMAPDERTPCGSGNTFFTEGSSSNAFIGSRATNKAPPVTEDPVKPRQKRQSKRSASGNTTRKALKGEAKARPEICTHPLESSSLPLTECNEQLRKFDTTNPIGLKIINEDPLPALLDSDVKNDSLLSSNFEVNLATENKCEIDLDPKSETLNSQSVAKSKYFHRLSRSKKLREVRSSFKSLTLLIFL